MWATVIDSKTKMCKVGLGTDEDTYKALGMKLMDVEQSIDGNYYVKGYAPTKNYIPYNVKRIKELKELLKSYDYIGIKIATGCATIEQYKKEIELCEEMRKEINKLEQMGE
jgi:hypothetical protein